MSAERYEQLHDLLSSYESAILRVESELQACQRALPEIENTAAEIGPLLPARASFARERSIRMLQRTARLHEIFDTFRREFGVLHRQVDKIRRDGRLTLIPMPEEKPGVQAEADYTLIRLGQMHFCVFARPREILRNRPVSAAPGPDELFPGPESLELFAPGRSHLNQMIFETPEGTLGVWFEEELQPVLEATNRVQVESAGTHPRIRGKFKFRGVDYYVLRVDTDSQES